MYLIERLIGIGTYGIILLIICQIISKSNKNNIKKILNIYLLCLVLMAYFFVPPSGEDLTRIIQTMQIYASVDTIDFITMIGSKSTPIAALYYHIIGKFNNPGLLPAITAFIVYSNVFYIIKDFAKRYKMNNKQISKSLFYIMATGFYVVAISNIRTLLSFSILAVAIYKEYIQKNSIIKSIPLYIISFLIHTSSIMIIILRFVSLILFESNTKYIKKIIFCIVFVAIYFIFNDYFLLALKKFETYYTEGNFFLIQEFIKITILLIYIMYLIHYYNKLKKMNLQDENITKLTKFISLIIIFVILLHKEFNIYLRVSYFISIIALPILLYNLKTIKENNISKTNFYTITLFCSLIMLGISASRGHLSSLKFFTLNQ